MKKNSTDTTAGRPADAPWTFLTNHSHVLLCIVQDPQVRIRDIAQRVGITERMVQKIIGDLVEADYLAVEKNGRRNTYELHTARPLRHPLESHRQVGEVLDLLRRGSGRTR